MKQRITGRVNGPHYEIVAPSGDVLQKVPLTAAREDRKLMAAIERNGWEQLP